MRERAYATKQKQCFTLSCELCNIMAVAHSPFPPIFLSFFRPFIQAEEEAREAAGEYESESESEEAKDIRAKAALYVRQRMHDTRPIHPQSVTQAIRQKNARHITHLSCKVQRWPSGRSVTQTIKAN